MKINKRSRIGILIQIIAFVTMLILVAFNKIIPSVLMWVFSVGTIIALIASLMELSKSKNKKERLRGL